jgi:hypothetical protein
LVHGQWLLNQRIKLRDYVVADAQKLLRQMRERDRPNDDLQSSRNLAALLDSL